jgi:hypothetical protein
VATAVTSRGRMQQESSTLSAFAATECSPDPLSRSDRCGSRRVAERVAAAHPPQATARVQPCPHPGSHEAATPAARPRTPRRPLGVKGSQVQILSARPCVWAGAFPGPFACVPEMHCRIWEEGRRVATRRLLSARPCVWAGAFPGPFACVPEMHCRILEEGRRVATRRLLSARPRVFAGERPFWWLPGRPLRRLRGAM